ncbi:hypothetical protein VTN31DRAFT_5525 [Thermomyces dupontii]|uniref:uncharacterized protein n=1 Tax=Talaromyces thermophilus TaxID=28565 RepID=UPI00374364BE
MSSADKTAADEGNKPDGSTPSASGAEAQAPRNATANVAADEEGSDLEELDDVLDDFSSNKPQRPATTAADASQSAATSSRTEKGREGEGSGDDEDFEEAFLKQLEADMSKLMAEGGGASGAAETQGKESIGDSGASSEAMKVVNEYIDKEIEALSKELQESGLKPEEFLQNLIAEAVSAGAQSGSGKDATSSTGAAAGEGGGEQRSQEKLSFQDTIRRTMERMQESGDRAASAAAAAGEDDLLAQMLKALEQGAQGAGDGGDLDKMIMGMMEQLSNKEMLYEPMKELDGKFRPWLRDNRDKCSPADLERYERQARIVGEIVRKFEEPDYADDKPECRSFIWDRMQEMQAAGNPPDDLIAPSFGDGDDAGPVPPECTQQ